MKLRQNPGKCDNKNCDNLVRFLVSTECACTDRLFSCYMCLSAMVMRMSEREDSHRDSECVMVTPQEIDIDE